MILLKLKRKNFNKNSNKLQKDLIIAQRLSETKITTYKPNIVNGKKQNVIDKRKEKAIKIKSKKQCIQEQILENYSI